MNWKKVKLFIKHDGKIPKSPEEIELERLQKERKEREAKIRAEKKRKLHELQEFQKQQKIKAQIEWEKGAEKRKLDAIEAKLDGELTYLDELEEPCKECGSDILDINGTCTATRCKAHTRPSDWYGQVKPSYVWGVNKESIFE